MIEALIKSLEIGLGLWASKDKRKYLDKLIRLKEDFYEEFNKPDDERSDAVIDNIKLELRILTEAFASQVTIQDPKDS